MTGSVLHSLSSYGRYVRYDRFDSVSFHYRHSLANAGKHRKVYLESLFKTFCAQVCAHLLKSLFLKA